MKKVILICLMGMMCLNLQAQLSGIFGFAKDTTLGTSKKLSPSEFAVQSYLGTNFAKTTNPDTNVVRFGRIVQNTSYREVPYSYDCYTFSDSLAIKGHTNKTVFIDNLVSTADFTSPNIGYKIRIEEKSNVNWFIRKWKNNGRQGVSIDCGDSNGASETSSNILDVGRYESDSLLAVNGAYMATNHYFRKISNKNLLFNYGQMYHNVASQLIYSGWNITNSNISFRIGEFISKIPAIQASYLYSGDYGAIYGGNAQFDNARMTVEIDLAKTGGLVAPINIQNAFINNSILTIKVKNASKYYGTAIPFIQVSGTTDATSRIVIEGNFINSSGPCVQISSNANVILRGSFETLSTTHGAIALTATAPNVKVQGFLKTGHTESITSTGAQSISILPGSSANKAVGASVTQVGSTLTVNAGY